MLFVHPFLVDSVLRLIMAMRALVGKKHEVNLPFLGVTKDFLRRHDIDPNQFAPRERIAWFCSELKVGDPNWYVIPPSVYEVMIQSD